MSKKFFVRTFGCQMNVYDSEKMEELLRKEKYVFTDDLAEANVILLNTCCVRQHAEDKVFSLLGKLEKLKKGNPQLKIIVAGCMAQLHGKDITKRFSEINLVLGTQHISDLPELLQRIDSNLTEKIIATNLGSHRLSVIGYQSAVTDYRLPITDSHSPLTTDHSPGYVAIMRGCNRFCSYCIVPYVRGKEWSRPVEDIVAEIENLVARGVKEITLLGQNVNAYNQMPENPSPYPLPQREREETDVREQKSDEKEDFADLLSEINKIEGLKKFGFITSHPGYFSDKLIKTLPTLSKFSRQIHLPAQSGSDRILRLMNRGYTREEYLKLLNKIRKSIPDVKIGSDFIVGFPSETEEDFEQTCSLVEEVRFSFAYVFKYSPRPGTMAAYLKDNIPLEVKKNRLARLLKIENDVRSGSAVSQPRFSRF